MVEMQETIQGYDSLTGLLNMDAFREKVREVVEAHDEEIEAGEYALLYVDIVRFKVINEIFGSAEGDEILRYLADVLRKVGGRESIACRILSDRFALFVHKKGEELQRAVDSCLEAIAAYPLTYEIVTNIGVYVTRHKHMTADSMLDRAVMAHSIIKGSYVERYKYYESSQRDAILSEQEIVGMMGSALEEEQFVVYYQPQYRHADQALVGAEALVRWLHPKRGMIPPNKFIPLFEENGFVTHLDIYVFDKVCKFIRESIDAGLQPVPISVNLSRRDIFYEGLLEDLEDIRKKYEVPVDLIRLEITESAVMDDLGYVVKFIDNLHDIGYIIEMDDFGSAYSSLNALKNIDLDILKLDMRFLKDDGDKKAGSIILSAVVRMAKWLGFPVIAEGVEHADQADYLMSIGCQYIQGYLYSKPIPQDDFRKLLAESRTEETTPSKYSFATMSAVDFWRPDSMETLIFSDFVGGAAIVEYHKGNIELLRINKKYLQEIGGGYSEEDLLRLPPEAIFDEEALRCYREACERAIASGEEIECEAWRNYTDNSKSALYIRHTLRVIGRSEDSYLLFSMIRDLTAEKRAMEELAHNEALFRAASEQADFYYWEYNIALKQMYPCYRCMRDMHLPKVLENYPESIIERSVFPKEIAEAYCDMHRRIEAGEPSAEMIAPLFGGKTMFHIRYTTQFDENGKPIRAFGSATKI